MDNFDEIILKAIQEKIKKGEQLTEQEQEIYNSLINEKKQEKIKKLNIIC